jgi:maltooligosyltrehalose trehalohydrolase
VGRHLVLIAESDLNDPRVIRSREAGGYGIDAQWSDDFHHALHALITRERSGYYEDFGTVAHFARALQQAYVYAGTPSRHRGRAHGRPVDDMPGWRFVVAAQNHDQVGNRAVGERLGHLTSRGRLKIAAALLLSAPFVPMLFQGEEWGASTPFLYFTAHEDAELGSQVSAGRRKEFAAFGWDPCTIPDPQSEETFEQSRLRWHELSVPPHAELLEWHRALVTLRRTSPSLRDGKYQDLQVAFDETRSHLTIRRGPIVVACNLGDEPTVIQVGAGRMLLASEEGVRMNGHTVYLPAESIAFVAAAPASEEA